MISSHAAQIHEMGPLVKFEVFDKSRRLRPQYRPSGEKRKSPGAEKEAGRKKGGHYSRSAPERAPKPARVLRVSSMKKLRTWEAMRRTRDVGAPNELGISLGANILTGGLFLLLGFVIGGGC